MIDIKKIIMCLFIIESSYIYSEDSITDENVTDEDLQEIDDSNDNKDSENTNNNKVKKSNSVVGGWYSGLDVKYIPSKLNAQETRSDNKTENYSIKNNLISPSMILGYDFLLNKLILGGECNIAFNFGSPIDYKDKVHNQDIAKITKGINFVGSIKLGVALGSWIVYGKIGGDLSKWKYDWKLDSNKNETEKKYKSSLLYGGGIEKQFLNNCYVRTEFSYSPSITHNNTQKNVKDCKMSEIKTTNYQISIGGGYRF